MSLVVDTCVLLDVLDADPEFGERSADALNAHADEGLLIAPVSYVEMAPAFLGDRRMQDDFLGQLGIALAEEDPRCIALAHAAWHAHVQRKRRGEAQRRPVADVLIGACALAQGGLITRNARHFRALFPALTVIEP